MKPRMASPADATAKLVYADWLTERGDPRGEFIRVQCEIARLETTGEAPVRLRELRQLELRLRELVACSAPPRTLVVLVVHRPRDVHDAVLERSGGIGPFVFDEQMGHADFSAQRRCLQQPPWTDQSWSTPPNGYADTSSKLRRPQHRATPRP